MTGKLLSLVADLMEVRSSELSEDAHFETLEKWDSQRQVELAVMLEYEYEITVSDDEMNSLCSLRDVRGVLAAHAVADP
jgi:acyl carrier protein